MPNGDCGHGGLEVAALLEGGIPGVVVPAVGKLLPLFNGGNDDGGGCCCDDCAVLEVVCPKFCVENEFCVENGLDVLGGSGDVGGGTWFDACAVLEVVVCPKFSVENGLDILGGSDVDDDDDDVGAALLLLLFPLTPIPFEKGLPLSIFGGGKEDLYCAE